MYDKFKTQILTWYKEHPATTIVAGVALVLTVGILIFFGSSSTLFQGNVNLQMMNPTKMGPIGVGDLIKTSDTLNLKNLNEVTQTPPLEKSIITDQVHTLADKFVIEQAPADALPVASNVNIDGELIVGITLNGTHNYVDSDNDVEAGSSYKWQRGDDATTQTDVVPPNTTASYTLTEADIGKYFIFEVTPKNDKGTGVAVTSGVVGPVVAATPNDTPPVASAVVISGAPTVGATLSGTNTYTDAEGDAEDGTTFRWLSGNETTQDSLAATTSTYPLADTDLGKYFVLEVTPKNANATGLPVLSAPLGPIVAAAPTGTAPVATNVEIVGDPLVGAALIGNYQYVDAEGDDEASSIYNWYIVDEAGTVITTLNTHDNLYQPTDADAGQYLAFGAIPLSTVAPTTGVEVISDPFGPITVADTTPTPPPPPANNDAPVDNSNDSPVDNTTQQTDQTPSTDFTPPAATASQNQNTNLSLTSNTNANLLGAAEVPGNTGPEVMLILPFLGFISFRLGRRLAKRK